MYQGVLVCYILDGVYVRVRVRVRVFALVRVLMLVCGV